MSRISDLVREEYERNPGFNRKEFAERHGIGERCVYRYLKMYKDTESVKPDCGGESEPGKVPERDKADKVRPLKTISVDELIDVERLDLGKIIKQALASLGPRDVIYDDQFRRDLDISLEKWRYTKVGDLADEFRDFKAHLPNKKIVWGRKTTIADLRQQDGVREP